MPEFFTCTFLGKTKVVHTFCCLFSYFGHCEGNLGLLYRTICAAMLLSMLFLARNLCLKAIKQNFLHVY